MKPYLLPLVDASRDLEQATHYISTHAAANPDIIGAASMPYMQLMGIVALGWMWARMAHCAQQALAGGEEDEFYRAKLVTAKFYMAYWAVQTPSLLKQIVHSSELITQLANDDFC